MAIHSEVSSLDDPFVEGRIIQVRTGKVKAVFGIAVQSAIYKTVRKQPVKVTKLGIEGDEHAFPLHGGPEKALMQYCAAHYETWKQELPESEHLFTLGGFGENIVASKANERNICIGDVIAFGDEVLVQVTYPRAPCAKLNQRFEIKDMSRRAQTLARTGWYYRVLREGMIGAGDSMKLVKRPNPEWSVSRVMHYLYIEKFNVAAMQEIVQLQGLGKEIHDVLQKRIENDEVEDHEGRLMGRTDDMAMRKWKEYRLRSRRMETTRIACVSFEAVDLDLQPIPVIPGSHVRVKLGGKLVRAYSIVAGDSNTFEIGVALEEPGRGGSKFLHQNAEVGDVLLMGNTTASFPMSRNADHHILIAGGVGITAFIASARALQRDGQSFELHYAVRSRSDVPFSRYLEHLENLTIYDKAAGQRLDIKSILSRSKANTHIYCCGPHRLRDAVTKAAIACDIDTACVHFEAFEVATGGQEFTAELAISRQILKVDTEHSLLEVLQGAGFDIDSSCEVGNCGTCKIAYWEGTVQHRGTALVKEEQKNVMLSCVSRGVGRIVLEL